MRLCIGALARPLPASLVGVIREVVARSERSSDERQHWSKAFSPVVKVLLALRMGEYQAALAQIEQYESYRSDRPIEAIFARDRASAWEAPLLRSLTLAGLNRDEEALQEFNRALSMRPQTDGVASDVFHIQDVLKRKAQAVLKEKGMLPR